MDVKAFCSELLAALAKTDFVEPITIEVEAFVVSGRAHLPKEMFLEVYFNEVTQATAFALIKEKARVWGVDKDNIRGWHRHPVNKPDSHVEIQPISVPEIVEELAETLRELGE